MILELCNDVPVQDSASLPSLVVNIQVRMLLRKAVSFHREALSFIKSDSFRLVYVKMAEMQPDAFLKNPRWGEGQGNQLLCSKFIALPKDSV